MRHWSYRVIKHITGDIIWFGIHDVYFRADDSVELYSEEPVVSMESLEDLESELEKLKTALAYPILDCDMLPEEVPGAASIE